MKIQQLTQQVGGAINKNSPTLLTGLAVAGLLTTVFMAVKATPKAMRLIRDELDFREESDDYPEFGSLSKKEIINVTYKCYIPAALMGVVTIGCIVGANSINLRRNAALASVYSISETALKEYQKKVVETIGTSKERKIKDDITKDKLAKNPVVDKEVIFTGHGDSLCYDALSGRYFNSDIERIRRVLNDVGFNLLHDMTVTLNEVYYALDLQGVKLGDVLGWDIQDGPLVPDFTSQLTDNGRPCLVLDFERAPKYIYGD